MTGVEGYMDGSVTKIRVRPKEKLMPIAALVKIASAFTGATVCVEGRLGLKFLFLTSGNVIKFRLFMRTNPKVINVVNCHSKK